LIRGPEACDDDNVSNGDGCAFNCQVETGYQCTGAPSNCTAICGDGFIRGLENCDDGDAASGDGCAGSICRQESGYTCTGQPSVCVLNCGDGNIDVPEQCDDGDNDNGDGCNSTCGIEPGYACGGTPSVCAPTCGNSLLNVSETCDDGNIVSGDGCSASCNTEPGWLCLVPGTACVQFEIFIDSPANGTFTTGSTSTITGHYTTLLPGTADVRINGVPATTVNPVLRTFSHTLSLSAANIFNPVRATVSYIPTGDDTHARIVVIRGDSVPDGMHSLQSVGMRINDTGLNQIEPLVGALAASQFDLGVLLPPGTVMADECFIDTFLGCLGSARVTIASPPPSFSHLTLAVDSKVNAVDADIDIFDLRLDINIDGSGLVPDCGLRLTANALHLTGDFALEPVGPASPSNVDVNLVTPLGVSFTGFNDTFTSGLCDAPIIGDIIQALLPDIQEFAINGIKGFMDDPDGAGPADSPIADGIETVLEGISIAGPVGAGVGLMLDTPLFAVTEDATGITFGSDSRFQVSVGNGPGQCQPPPGAPDFSRSYSKPEAFPVFGANTPLGGVPYGLGIGISTAGFNQLLRGQTECGLMRTSLTTIDLDGPGGSPPLAITSSLLSLLVPEFGQLPANTPLRIDVAPTVAPIITGNTGPAGELTELKIAQVQIDIVQVSNSKVWMRGYLDGRLGLNLAFLPDGSGLAITVATPAASDLTIAIIGNPLDANETTVETVLPAIIRPLIPSLAGALSGFPLPQFFGLQLQGLEVSRQGQFLSLYANLTPVP
jgi:cysteine-rich repeat protein